MRIAVLERHGRKPVERFHEESAGSRPRVAEECLMRGYSTSGRHAQQSPVNLDTIQPVILVGGKSRRFGRDKLREPIGGISLVSKPIEALRAVFGPRVALVGECDSAVAALGDLVLPDPYPGVGPAGGILAALEHASGPVFVLSGDLPSITPGAVRTILNSMLENTGAHAYLGQTDRPQPCIAVYRRSAVEAIREAMSTGRGLHRAIGEQDRVLVPIDPDAAYNVNRPGDLPRADPRPIQFDRSDSDEPRP